ncbi:hypothetical protein M8C21_032465, partial [Ambrosia artemisiifolia]
GEIPHFFCPKPPIPRHSCSYSLQNLDTGFNTGTRSPPTLENPNFSKPPPLIPHPSHDISANVYVNGEDKQQYATNSTPFDPSAAKHQKTRTNLRYQYTTIYLDEELAVSHVILRLGFIYGTCRAGNLELPLDFIGFPLEKAYNLGDFYKYVLVGLKIKEKSKKYKRIKTALHEDIFMDQNIGFKSFLSYFPGQGWPRTNKSMRDERIHIRYNNAVVRTFVPFYPVRIAMFVNRLFSVPTQLHLLLKGSPVSDHLHHSTTAVGLSDCTSHGWDAMTAMNSNYRKVTDTKTCLHN